MFGQKKSEDAPPSLMAQEGRMVALLNREGYGWLGKRYEWYNKIRTAKKDGLKLFADASLEEQMEATRSALNLVTRTLHTGLFMAYNAVVDGVKNAGTQPENWPAKLEGDRNNPPQLTEEQDALVLSWMPLKFLNLAKSVRDKGKGLDFYSDGLIKKLYFKVIGYYADPRYWRKERLGYFLTGLDPEANLQEVQGKLGMLKTEVDLLTNSLQLFRFGRAPRRKEAGAKNTMEETFEISDSELIADLYFQSLLVHGLESFLFRYYLTLLSAVENPRAVRQISQIFEPLLLKMEELKQRFQGSFMMEREKIRLRKNYLEFFQQREALPPTEVVEQKGKQVRRINYTHKLLEGMALPRAMQMPGRGAQNWEEYLKHHVVDPGGELGFSRLLEIFNTLVRDTMAAMEGKIAVARQLREFADEQEKMGKMQLNLKKKKLDETKRRKNREKIKFKTQEQKAMVEEIEKEIAQLEAEGTREIEQMDGAIAKRRESQIARVDQLEKAALQDRQVNQGKLAGQVYQIFAKADTERKVRSEMVPRLVHFLQEDKSDEYTNLYRNFFKAVTDLFPTEKMLIRNVVNQRFPLEDNELVISEEEMTAYQGQIENRKAELDAELPGVLDQALSQGAVRAKVSDLLKIGLKRDSLMLLFGLTFNAPNKPAAKLPGNVVKKLLIINQLEHPMPEHDIILPNVDASAPVTKRVNFSRLQKLTG